MIKKLFLNIKILLVMKLTIYLINKKMTKKNLIRQKIKKQKIKLPKKI